MQPDLNQGKMTLSTKPVRLDLQQSQLEHNTAVSWNSVVHSGPTMICCVLTGLKYDVSKLFKKGPTRLENFSIPFAGVDKFLSTRLTCR